MKKNVNMNGILNGIANLVEKIGDLAEKGEQFKRAMEEIERGKEGKVYYDVNVQVGLGGKTPDSSHRQGKIYNHNPIPETREPITDLFDESNYILITVEMPGISVDEVRLDLQDRQLTIQAENKHKRYYKELCLPVPCHREKINLVCNNGILEITCPKI